jgi:hypothetical protein
MIELLSYFVKYKESVDNASITKSTSALMNDISNTIGCLNNYTEASSNIASLQEQQHKITEELLKFNELLSEFKNSVEINLRRKESEYLSKSYKLYEENKQIDTPEYIIERLSKHPLISNNSIKKRIIHDISEHCSWKHPGVVIRPGNCELMDSLISLDPLYVVDENLVLLDCIKSKWNEVYQSRLRYSIIDDSSDIIFKTIPKNQIGFILVTDFFNYKPIEVIKNYCTEIFDLLKPGGIMLFTYNNCNLANAVRNFEKVLYSYTPGSLVIPMLELINFELIKTFNDSNTNTNWVVVKKPGILSSLRGGQCLGEINI